MSDQQPIEPLRWRRAVVCGVAIFLAYITISCDFQASKKLAETEAGAEYVSDDNQVAQRQKGVTGKSVLGFLMMGAIGAACLAIRSGRPLAIDPLVALPMIAYFSYCYASVLWSDQPSLTVRKLGVLTFFLVAAVGFARAMSVRELATACAVCCGLWVAMGVAAELAVGTFKPWRGSYRFAGIGEPNGNALDATIMTLVGLFVLRPMMAARTAANAFTGGSFLVLVLTKSRTGLAGFLVAAAGGMLSRAKGSERLILLGLAVVSACGLVAAVAVSGSGAAEGIMNTASMGRTEHVTELNGRVPLWTLLLGEAAENPLGGVGYAAFWTTKRIQDISDEFYWHIPQAHSVYVDLLLQLGVVGLSLYGLMMLAALARVAMPRENADSGHAFITSIILFALINGLSESKFLATGLAPLLLTALLVQLGFFAAQTEPVAESPQRPAAAKPPQRRFLWAENAAPGRLA